MKPISRNHFGPDGIQCIFAVDADGTPAIGYIIKQLGTKKYLITDGETTKACLLAQTADDVADLPDFIPAGLCTFLLDVEGDTHHIMHLDSTRCSTIEGDVPIDWVNGGGTILVPELAPPPLGPRFDIVSILPGFAGGHGAAPIAMSSDLIVGHASNADFNQRAVFWDSDNVLTELTLPDGASVSTVLAVSQSSVYIVGSAQFFGEGPPITLPVLWINGVPMVLPPLTEGQQTEARGVSSIGKVVGWCNVSDDPITNVAVYWTVDDDFSAPHVLAAPTGNYIATVISDDGTVIGGAMTINYFTHTAVYWDHLSVLHELPHLPSGSDNYVSGLSSDGKVKTGTAHGAGYAQYAVYWDHSDVIHQLPRAEDGNYSASYGTCSADGRIIGGSGDITGGDQVALCWFDGEVRVIVTPPDTGFAATVDAISPDGLSACGETFDGDSNLLAIKWTTTI